MASPDTKDPRFATIVVAPVPGRPETIPPQPRPTPQPAKPAKKVKTAAATAPATVLEAPALPISADKHQRLQELLRKYQADQITPEQYHLQRAKVLAEP